MEMNFVVSMAFIFIGFVISILPKKVHFYIAILMMKLDGFTEYIKDVKEETYRYDLMINSGRALMVIGVLIALITLLFKY